MWVVEQFVRMLLGILRSWGLHPTLDSTHAAASVIVDCGGDFLLCVHNERAVPGDGFFKGLTG